MSVWTSIVIAPRQTDFVPTPETIAALIDLLDGPTADSVSISSRWDAFNREPPEKHLIWLRRPTTAELKKVFLEHAGRAILASFLPLPWLQGQGRDQFVCDGDYWFGNVAIAVGPYRHRDAELDGAEFTPAFSLLFSGNGSAEDFPAFIERFRSSIVFCELAGFLESQTGVPWRALYDCDHL